MHKAILFLSFFLTLFATVQAQSERERLALSFYSEGEYEKAAEIYEDLLKKAPQSAYYYENYLQCLLKLEDFKKAVKFTEKYSRTYPGNIALLVDVGYVKHLSGETKQAEKIFQDVIKHTEHQTAYVTNAANAFNKRGLTDWAILTYKRARDRSRNITTYAIELADLYAEKGDYSAMFGEFLQYVEIHPSYSEQVQTRIQQFITEDEHYSALKKELITRSQRNPDNTGYQELLFWVFTQLKDWNGAFVQVRAIDMRSGKSGRQVFDLAQVCLDNEAYETATKCYEYLKSLGSDHPLYSSAQRGVLKTRFAQIKKTEGANKDELKKLENDYVKFIEDRGHLSGGEQAYLDLADLYIYYMADATKGIKVLESYIKVHGRRSKDEAKAKLKLADAYLLSNDEWEAHLLYKQVEKDFKDDPLGQEARFRFAKLSYFRGEFDWALTQLEVLRGATTQLISNNAIELSLHIIENSGLDTSYEALEIYAKAEMHAFMSNFDSAVALLAELKTRFPGHELRDDIIYLEGRMAEKQGKVELAIEKYEEVARSYYYDLLADNALIKLARIYDYRLENKSKALELYQKIILEYSNSFYVYEARKRYHELKNMEIVN
jgi:tetratricopeptide (TPR) repeat protein